MKKSYIIELLLSFLFFGLGFYHLQYRDVFLVKVGTTHFFSLEMVGVLSYVVPVVCIIAAVLLWIKEYVKIPAAMIVILSAAYLLYIWMIYTRTDSSCDCTNLFMTVGLKWQTLFFSLCILLSGYLLASKKKKLPSLKTVKSTTV